MKNKLFILLIFACLARSAYVPTLKADYGLSKKQAVVLHRIMVSQELTITICSAAFTTLFDAIRDLGAGIDNQCSKIAKALTKVKAAMNTTLDPDILALGESCSAAVEVARKLAHADFDDAFAQINAALKLARLGNYSKNRAAIEHHHAVARKDYKSLIGIDYDVLIKCLCTTDADTLAVIQNARKGSLVSGVGVIDGVFNAIKVYAAAVPVECGDLTFITDIEDIKVEIFANIKTYVEYKFSVLRTLYINSCLNQCGIVSGVAQSQYIEALSFLEYMKGNEVFFSIATKYLRRIDLGLCDDRNKNAFSATNVSLAEINAEYDVADNAILDLILFIHPDSGSKIAAAREYLHTTNVGLNVAIVNVFDVVVGRSKTYTEKLDFIETFTNATVAPASDYTQYIFDLIRNNRTFDRKTEATLTTLQNVTYYGAVVNTIKFFDAAIVLANASHTGVVRKRDYSAIQVFQDESNEGLDGFTQGVTAACLLVFRTMTACSAGVKLDASSIVSLT